MTENKRRSPPSERPPEDLTKERDAFIEQFFRKGAQFTEDLLSENKRLHDRIAELEAQNSKLRAHLASDTAMRDLLTKIEELEREKLELINRSSHMEAVTSNYTSRFSEVEDELSNLANLYVATTQIYSGHSVRAVLRTLKELLAQFLGAASYAIYIISEDKKELVAVASEGINRAEIARLPANEGPLGETFLKGELFFERNGDTSKGTVESPAAVIPLGLDAYTVGVIAIFATLTQKTEFGRVDSELFKLLGDHAGAALVSARLFTDAGRKVPIVQAFLDSED
jgi:hypothetical protein